jgi:hypothetical protein
MYYKVMLKDGEEILSRDFARKDLSPSEFDAANFWNRHNDVIIFFSRRNTVYCIRKESIRGIEIIN